MSTLLRRINTQAPEGSTQVTGESIDQLKARLKREDEEKKKAFQKTLEGIRESQAPFRAEQEAKKRAEHQERETLRGKATEPRGGDEDLRAPGLDRRGREGRGVRDGVAADEDRDAEGARPGGRLCSRAAAARAQPQGLLGLSWWKCGSREGRREFLPQSPLSLPPPRPRAERSGNHPFATSKGQRFNHRGFL
jgi:hypothetical protein